ncbi:ABC transporter permease [Noviherbaspirillum sp. Root189]|uniref:ABC transporter permease n=1 Tax=Noviherbaspirillum sp. Root189 TaxID=1736487 RepID=UPI000A7AA2C1|nr:ABC transporter permease subunit [Noviherbaspirillum sp. Root189]
MLVLLCVWEVLALGLDSKALPSPQNVLRALWQELYAGELLFHLGMTLSRVTISFILAMLVGVALGILMGSFRHWDNRLDVLIILGMNIPALVTIILCYVWFGLTETAAIIAVTVNKIPMVTVTIREGARAINTQLLQVASVYRLSRRDTFFSVYLPQLYPYLFASARNGLSLIWKIVLVVELLGRSDGIGFQLGSFFHFFDITNILAYTLAFILVIFAIEALLFHPLASRLTRWRT